MNLTVGVIAHIAFSRGIWVAFQQRPILGVTATLVAGVSRSVISISNILDQKITAVCPVRGGVSMMGWLGAVLIQRLSCHPGLKGVLHAVCFGLAFTLSDRYQDRHAKIVTDSKNSKRLHLGIDLMACGVGICGLFSKEYAPLSALAAYATVVGKLNHRNSVTEAASFLAALASLCSYFGQSSLWKGALGGVVFLGSWILSLNRLQNSD